MLQALVISRLDYVKERVYNTYFPAATLASSEVQIMVGDFAPHIQNNEWTGPGVPQ